MLTVVRLFESDQQADSAVAKLTDLDFLSEDITRLSPGAGDPASSVSSAIKAGRIAGSYRSVLVGALSSGRHVVAIEPPFGRGDLAGRVMDSCGAVDTEQLPEYVPYNPSPLSDFLGIPTLASYEHTFNIRQLSTFSLSGSVGMGHLSKNPTPLSSLVGLKTVSKPKSNWKSSLGLPLLSHKAAPLSSLLGLKQLTTPKRGKTTSFGFPMLSKNPTPLSSLFNIPLLSKRER
ncbi:MAG: hypothetical protein AB8B96_20720 [Lysobacterales bacterium]